MNMWLWGALLWGLVGIAVWWIDTSRFRYITLQDLLFVLLYMPLGPLRACGVLWAKADRVVIFRGNKNDSI